MVEVVYVEFQEITVELRAGPIRGNFPETIETFIITGTRDSRTVMLRSSSYRPIFDA